MKMVSVPVIAATTLVGNYANITMDKMAALAVDFIVSITEATDTKIAAKIARGLSDKSPARVVVIMASGTEYVLDMSKDDFMKLIGNDYRNSYNTLDIDAVGSGEDEDDDEDEQPAAPKAPVKGKK